MLSKMKFIRIICVVAASIGIMSSLYVRADSVEYEKIPYTNYTYWQGYSNKKAVQTKAAFRPLLSEDLTKYADPEIMDLQHICCDRDGNTYILDSGNGKIFVFNTQYKFVKTIEYIENGSEKLSFVGAKGLYFDSENTMYIADTANKRVIMEKKGKVEVINCSKDDIIPKDFVFSPSRVAVDKNGFLYILCEGSYYGLMVLTGENNDQLLGFFGASKVTSSVLDALTGWVTGLFETREKHEASVKKLPYQLKDITVNSSGLLVAVTTDTVGQIRMFAPTGNNILRVTDQFKAIDGDGYNFADFPNSFSQVTSTWGVPINQLFVGITTDSDGFMYALDSTQGRIYMYDEACHLISVFGGGIGVGNQLGTFVTPQSLVANGQYLSVVDIVNKNLTVFEINEYGDKIKKAQLLTNAGDYEAAKPLWNEILSQDKTCQLAYIGLAKSAMMEKDYKSAMSYAKSGLDRKIYSQVYKYVRNDFVGKNLKWFLIILIILIVAGVITKYYLTKKGIKIKIPLKYRICGGSVFHPIKSYSEVAKSNVGSVWLAIGLLLMFYVATVLKQLISSFSVNTTDVTSFNAIYILVGTIGTMLLYVVCNWAICTLLEGKGKFKDIFITSSYSLQPLIICSFLYIILSYVVIPDGSNSLAFLDLLFKAVFVVWLLISITVIHDFSFFKAIGAGILILIGMAIALFVIFIVLTLGQDLIAFVIGIISEATLRS